MIKKLTKKKKIEILEYLKEMIKKENQFLCVGIRMKFYPNIEKGDKRYFTVKNDFPELWNEAPVNIKEFNETEFSVEKSWFTLDKDGWNQRKQAVENTLKTLGK